MGAESKPDDPPPTYGTMVETAIEHGGVVIETTENVGPSPIGPQDGSPVNPDKPEPPPS